MFKNLKVKLKCRLWFTRYKAHLPFCLAAAGQYFSQPVAVATTIESLPGVLLYLKAKLLFYQSHFWFKQEN